MITTIYLIRHGETLWNREKRHQGHQDIPLNTVGMEQASQLAKNLENKSITTIYSSDLKRAHATAQAIAERLGLRVITSTDLRERYSGEWEGLSMQEIQEKYPNWEKAGLTGGMYGIELTENVENRMLSKLEQISMQHLDEHIVVVSHGFSINTVLSKITNGEYGIGKSKLDNTSITQLSYESSGGWKLHQLNDTTHMKSKGVENCES